LPGIPYIYLSSGKHWIAPRISHSCDKISRRRPIAVHLCGTHQGSIPLPYGAVPTPTGRCWNTASPILQISVNWKNLTVGGPVNSGMRPSMRSPARNRTEAQHTVFEEARRAWWDTPPLVVVQSTLQFAFAVIVNEAWYSQILQIISFLNTVVPGEKT
jgi:hypothetical protein